MIANLKDKLKSMDTVFIERQIRKMVTRHQTSLFEELLKRPYNKVNLLMNYRNHRDVVEWAQEFYDRWNIRLKSKSQEENEKREKGSPNWISPFGLA